MNRHFTQTAIFVSLIALGVLTRCAPKLLGIDTYNVTATAAAGLFAGFYFSRWQVALIVPLAIMAFSDIYLGGYDWQMMAGNYAAMLTSVAIGRVLQGRLSAGNVLFASLATSIVFFLLSNFAEWLYWGAPGLAGITKCYVDAIPFFGRTLVGDLGFATALFGAYALATQTGQVEKPAIAS